MWGGAYGGGNKTSGDPAVTGATTSPPPPRASPAASTITLARQRGGPRLRRRRHQLERVAQGLGGGKSDAFQAGIYGATKSGPAYLAATFAFTNHWMSTDRLAFGDHLTASFIAELRRTRRRRLPASALTTAASLLMPRSRRRASTPGLQRDALIPNGFALAFASRDATDTAANWARTLRPRARSLY